MTTNDISPADSAGYERAGSDFIRDIIDEDLKTAKHGDRVATRFPPEPNGYLHIGHAKSICLNFGIAAQYHGTCNLRLDDTDPSGESLEYVESIINDVHWLGFDWDDRLFYASDYYRELYEFAEKLIRRWQGLRLRPEPRGDTGVSRHPHRTGQRKPVQKPYRRREPRPLQTDACGANSRTEPSAPREDRYGVTERCHARPCYLPHQTGRPLSHRHTNGSSTPCMTSPTVFPTTWRG